MRTDLGEARHVRARGIVLALVFCLGMQAGGLGMRAFDSEEARAPFFIPIPVRIPPRAGCD